MKKYLSLTIFIILCSLFVVQVQAESDENVTKRRPDRPAQAAIQEIRQENRSKVAENHANRLERRFGFYYDRLSKIIVRFEARLVILDNAGKNTADSKAKLALAKTKLEAAKVAGQEAVVQFRAIDPAKFSEQKTEAFAARDLAVSARKLFQESHQLLKDALKSLKTISKPALPAAKEAL